MTKDEVFKAAEERLGLSRQAVAHKLGLSGPATYRWGELVPVQHVVAIEELFGGEITRHQMQPELSEIFGSRT